MTCSNSPIPESGWLRNVPAGKYFKLTVSVLNSDGSSANLAGMIDATFMMARYDHRGGYFGNAVVTKTLGAGLTPEDAEAGLLLVELEPDDTEGLTGLFYAEIETTDGNGHELNAALMVIEFRDPLID